MLSSIIEKAYRVASDHRAEEENMGTYFPAQIHSAGFPSIKSLRYSWNPRLLTQIFKFVK